MKKFKTEIDFSMEGTLVLIQDSGFNTIKMYPNLEKMFYKELNSLSEKLKKNSKIFFINNIIADGIDYYTAIDSILGGLPKTSRVVLITSSMFYGPGKKPGDLIRKHGENKNFSYAERSAGNKFEKECGTYNISKDPGQLEKLFIELGLFRE